METLSELIPRYFRLKTEMDSYKKQVDEDNKAIKLIMSTDGLSEETCDGLVAKYTIIDKSYFDEEKLLSKIKDLGLTECVKTKEYVDMNSLENLLYSGELKAEDIKDCKVEKHEERLIVKKAKEA